VTDDAGLGLEYDAEVAAAVAALRPELRELAAALYAEPEVGFAEHASVGPKGLATCDALAERTLSLPLHVGLTDNDVTRVCETLLKLVAR